MSASFVLRSSLRNNARRWRRMPWCRFGHRHDCQPEPVVVGKQLTILSQSPIAASTAKTSSSAISSPPPSFPLAVLSPGGYSQSGGIVSCNFGTIDPEARPPLPSPCCCRRRHHFLNRQRVLHESDPDSSNNSVNVLPRKPATSISLLAYSRPEPVVLGALLLSVSSQ